MLLLTRIIDSNEIITDINSRFRPGQLWVSCGGLLLISIQRFQATRCGWWIDFLTSSKFLIRASTFEDSVNYENDRCWVKFI